MMEILLCVMIGFAGLRSLVAFVNWVSQPLLPIAKGIAQPPLSILIPARNEEPNLPRLLAQLDLLTYPALEIIVLDDHSEDRTAEILNEHAQQDPRLQVLSGQALPAGWLGKHWACHQLAQAANGTYFLFLDADISSLHDGLPDALLHEAQQQQLALISLFPEQEMLSIGERIVVPIMHEILLTLLPLALIRRLPFPSIAAANGQCMFFERQSYLEHRWHEQTRAIVVEDIAIMQRVKKAGLRGMTFVGNGWIRCRMYRSYREGLQGFSKNILAGFGGSIVGLLIYLFLLMGGWIILLPTMPAWGFVTAFLLIGSRRIFTSLLAQQSVGWNLLLHPLQMVTMVYIGALSIIKRLSGTNTWKGRSVA